MSDRDIPELPLMMNLVFGLFILTMFGKANKIYNSFSVMQLPS